MTTIDRKRFDRNWTINRISGKLQDEFIEMDYSAADIAEITSRAAELAVRNLAVNEIMRTVVYNTAKETEITATVCPANCGSFVRNIADYPLTPKSYTASNKQDAECGLRNIITGIVQEWVR